MHPGSSNAGQVVEPSRRRREPRPNLPPLFRSCPEENFSLWVQNCFPGASLAREDAIRQWLATPLEARVKRSNNHHPPKIAGSNDSETPAATAGKAESVRQLLLGVKKNDPFVGHSAFRIRNYSGAFLRLAKFTVLVLLVLTVFWGVPVDKRALQASISIAGTQPNESEPAGDPSVVQNREAIVTKPDFVAAPMTIESVSIECEETTPCIEIRTRGRGVLPSLSTLSDPDRIVLDFQYAAVSSEIHRTKAGHGSIKAVRIGDGGAQPPHVRVVIDLTEKCEYELHALINGVEVKVYRKGTALHAE